MRIHQPLLSRSTNKNATESAADVRSDTFRTTVESQTDRHNRKSNEPPRWRSDFDRQPIRCKTRGASRVRADVSPAYSSVCSMLGQVRPFDPINKTNRSIRVTRSPPQTRPRLRVCNRSPAAVMATDRPPANHRLRPSVASCKLKSDQPGDSLRFRC